MYTDHTGVPNRRCERYCPAATWQPMWWTGCRIKGWTSSSKVTWPGVGRQGGAMITAAFSVAFHYSWQVGGDLDPVHGSLSSTCSMSGREEKEPSCVWHTQWKGSRKWTKTRATQPLWPQTLLSYKKPLHQGPASPLRTGPKTESWAGLLLSDS